MGKIFCRCFTFKPLLEFLLGFSVGLQIVARISSLFFAFAVCAVWARQLGRAELHPVLAPPRPERESASSTNSWSATAVALKSGARVPMNAVGTQGPHWEHVSVGKGAGRNSPFSYSGWANYSGWVNCYVWGGINRILPINTLWAKNGSSNKQQKQAFGCRKILGNDMGALAAADIDQFSSASRLLCWIGGKGAGRSGLLLVKYPMVGPLFVRPVLLQIRGGNRGGGYFKKKRQTGSREAYKINRSKKNRKRDSQNQSHMSAHIFWARKNLSIFTHRK